MNLTVPLIKMHGARNDFILLDERPARIADYAMLAREVCDRRSGIGADGLLVILDSDTFDARMRMLNPDGSEAEMCGNGMRCVARYLDESGAGAELTVETEAGPIQTHIVSREPYLVRLGMGLPSFSAQALGYDGPYEDLLDASLDLDDGMVRFSGVSLGNPHAVVFVSDVADIDLPYFGHSIGQHEAFPNGINAHAVQRLDRSTLMVRHWERGAGATEACGTGAVACAVAAIARGFADAPVNVNVPGGALVVEWDGRGQAYLTGEAVRVFQTDYAIRHQLLAARSSS